MNSHSSKLSAVGFCLAILLLASCGRKPSYIYPAPGAPDPGTFLIGIMDTTKESPAGWFADFHHKEKGAWSLDTSVSLSQDGFLLLSKFQYHRYWAKACVECDTFRIQVRDPSGVRDESVMILE
ncbi:MAG: hypothetical protein H6686_09335 [Fibrobacteria bacterium]|nr:hypothetical protein [Fibrobacteria bacterium]